MLNWMAGPVFPWMINLWNYALPWMNSRSISSVMYSLRIDAFERTWDSFGRNEFQPTANCAKLSWVDRDWLGVGLQVQPRCIRQARGGILSRRARDCRPDQVCRNRWLGAVITLCLVWESALLVDSPNLFRRFCFELPMEICYWNLKNCPMKSLIHGMESNGENLSFLSTLRYDRHDIFQPDLIGRETQCKAIEAVWNLQRKHL